MKQIMIKKIINEYEINNSDKLDHTVAVNVAVTMLLINYLLRALTMTSQVI
jgi:hypothetical protein